MTCCKTIQECHLELHPAQLKILSILSRELLSVPRPSHSALGCHGQLPRSPEQMWLESQACGRARGDDSCCLGSSFNSNEISFSAHKLFLLISAFITAVVFASSLSLSSCLKGRFVHSTSGAQSCSFLFPTHPVTSLLHLVSEVSLLVPSSVTTNLPRWSQSLPEYSSSHASPASFRCSLISIVH